MLYSRLTGECWQPTSANSLVKRLGRMRQRVYYGIVALAECQANDGGRVHMLTLTYARVGDWEPRHISHCMAWLRDQGVRAYVWVAELQRRGAVHYHVLALYPDGQRWVKPDVVHGGWAHGFSFVTQDVLHPFYLMKYLQKDGSKHGTFPTGLRLYGMSQWSVRRLSCIERCGERATMLPRWFVGEMDYDLRVLDARRVPGGVQYGDFVGLSPYSTRPPDTVDEVEAKMYNSAWGNGLLP